MTLWTRLFVAYKILQNDGHSATGIANYRNALTIFRSAHPKVQLHHILKNLHDNYTGGR